MVIVRQNEDRNTGMRLIIRTRSIRSVANGETYWGLNNDRC